MNRDRMVKYLSPLRYPGGKRVLTPFVSNILITNGLSDGIYGEAYCGGAGIALELLTKELVRTININDIDYRIFAFWESIIKDTEQFLKLLNKKSINVREWKRQKAILDNPHDYNLLEIGFATFYINRCNRSGILNGGPIGGYEQHGKWGIDARFSKKELAERIEFIALYSDRIKVWNLDAIDFLKDVVIEEAKSKNPFFVYLDPPYYSMGDSLYLNFYKKEDHAELAKFLQNIDNLHWVLTYDDVPEIRKLYRNLTIIESEVLYSAQTHKTGRELVILSPNLEVASPRT